VIAPRRTTIAAICAAAAAVFAVLTALVTTQQSLGIDATAFDVVDDLREPWLDHAARFVTTFGTFGIVGPVVAVAAFLLYRRGYRVRPAALAVGALLTWATVWITKGIVGRARPPDPLVHAGGPSYPSAHAANSMGWLALALAAAVMIPNRIARIAAVAAGAILAVSIGLTRIYLRAHYASDVIGGEALAIAIYAVAVLAAEAVSRKWSG
jgi:undecaprenyl-diphosphatase